MTDSRRDKPKIFETVPGEILDPVIREAVQSPRTAAMGAVLGKLSQKERDKMLASWWGAPGRAVKAIRDIRSFPIDRYRLESDGRKWKHVALERRSIANQLATHANPDGTSITVGVARLVSDIGIPKRTLFRRLDELKTLGLLSSQGLTEEHGTRVRALDLSKLRAGVPDSPDTEQECQIENRAGVPDRKAGVPDSGAGVPSKVAQNRPSLPAMQTGLSLSLPGSGAGAPEEEPTKQTSVVVVPAAPVSLRPVHDSDSGLAAPNPAKPTAKELPEWVLKIWHDEHVVPLQINKSKLKNYPDARNLEALIQKNAQIAGRTFGEVLTALAWATFVHECEGTAYNIVAVTRKGPDGEWFEDQESLTRWPLGKFLSDYDSCLALAKEKLEKLRVNGRSERHAGELYDDALAAIEKAWGAPIPREKIPNFG